uniref:Protein Flattop n=1 Tax=Molossus molossus TaxID=27622 RepID=A0A7J8CQD3_MOLMO|nr:cilia and flagella associated protein 126 [Molossus molossus]
MATNYSANQYEKAFSPKYLQNWSLAKPTKEASPWGSFMGTWQMPLKIPPARVTLTSRTAAGAASLTNWIQKNPDLLNASNGLRPEILGKPHNPDSRKKPRKSVQQAPSPTIIPSSPASNLSSPDQPQSAHPSAGHTPGPLSTASSPRSPPGSPCAENTGQVPSSRGPEMQM